MLLELVLLLVEAVVELHHPQGMQMWITCLDRIKKKNRKTMMVDPWPDAHFFSEILFFFGGGEIR